MHTDILALQVTFCMAAKLLSNPSPEHDIRIRPIKLTSRTALVAAVHTQWA